MVSRAIAALDDWLQRAEEVLAEQREQCISPSLGWVQDHDERMWDPLESTCRHASLSIL